MGLIGLKIPCSNLQGIFKPIYYQTEHIFENKYIIKAGKKNAWAVSVGGYIFSHISTVYGPGY